MSDANNDEIGELIKQEDDPKNRAFLIILQNINLSLIANTKTVNDIDIQLKEHLEAFNTRAKKEDELINKGKGAWRVVSWILGIVQALTIWIVLQAWAELQDMHKADHSIENRITVIEEKIK